MARGSEVAPVIDTKTRKATGTHASDARSGSDGRKLSGPWGASFDGKGTKGLTFERRWTRPGVHPYDEIEWETRNASIGNESGKTVFEQKDVEVPKFWSQLATNVVVSKYFRGHVGTAERETSVRQLIDRVVNTITGWAETQRYFATEEDLRAFQAELTHLLVHQKMAFNSPVWFNVGVEPKPQCSACFINSVQDTMSSIMDLAKTEAMLFKFGSGAGSNLSTIRSSKERMTGGGTASGPVSFMKGYDAFAGVVKSGGKTRRAAKMVILDAGHPDIVDFIDSKLNEEKKAWALIEAGYDPSFTGEAYGSVFFQNANHSVRVTDDFMRAVVDGKDWTTYSVVDKQPMETYKAKDLFRRMAAAAWVCGDPGIQYDTTINDWHTSANTDRIYASNPCCFVGETLIDTADGFIPFQRLEEMDRAGVPLPQVYSYDKKTRRTVLQTVNRVWVAGKASHLVEIQTERGRVLRCTPEHRWLTFSGVYVQAQQLTPGTRLRKVYRDEVAAPISARSVSVTEARAENDRVVSVQHLELGTPVPVYDMEVEGTHNFAVSESDEPSIHSIVVSNSEYMFLNDTACNLASLNLMKFVRDDGEFDVEAYRYAARLTITAQEILVDNASYPTPKIEENSHKFRPLGLGYANLGALLMSRGLAYDSDEGRNYAAALTAIMHGEAYRQSSIVARDHGGPFREHKKNEAPFLRVIAKHRDAAYAIPADRAVPADMIAAARTVYDEALELGKANGYRNAQVTVLAPTGTIAFMMDCDTTGIEPDIALIKYKKLVGEGFLKIVNQTVPAALRKLGYGAEQVEEILAYVNERETIEGAPHLKPEHLPVFDCAFKPVNGERSIHYMGHVRMMGAVQPFISGAISKTVNMPETATPDEIERVYLEGWKLGLKAIAIYRDNSKRSQPLSTGKKKDSDAVIETAAVEQLRKQLAVAQAEASKPHRRRLPSERTAITHKFDIAGHEGYITVGLYPDGQPGEIFLKMAKEGSTVSGLMDTFATTVSVALQYGVPLRDLVNKFAHVRFEPSGFTGNQEIPIAKSIVDYIFRWLGSRFLSPDDKAMLGLIDRSALVNEPPVGGPGGVPGTLATASGSDAIGGTSLPAQPEEPRSSGDKPKATAVAVDETKSSQGAFSPDGARVTSST
ncbi:MAG: hypothetical protein M3067_14655, partial [Chloroflexota bacterium]|nr:hypothetical protein [Chloroflexota bacterium]